MAYLVALFGVTIGLLLFMWVYGRRLEALSGPWIVTEGPRHG